MLVGAVATLLSGPDLAKVAATQELRHSGRIVEVSPDRGAIVLEAIVAWNGPGTAAVNRSMPLTPRTSITLVERAEKWEPDRTTMVGWNRVLLDGTGCVRGLCGRDDGR
jgi:hypothetical protein